MRGFMPGVLFMLLVMAGAAYGQENAQEAAPAPIQEAVSAPKEEAVPTPTISGEVAAVLLDESTIVVKPALDAQAGVYDNTIANSLFIRVSAETVILKGESNIALADIKDGDKVTVECVKLGEKEIYEAKNVLVD